MNPEAGQAWFRIAMLITLVSAALLFFVEPGTAEFVVTVTALVIGLLFIGVIAVLVRRGSR